MFSSLLALFTGRLDNLKGLNMIRIYYINIEILMSCTHIFWIIIASHIYFYFFWVEKSYDCLISLDPSSTFDYSLFNALWSCSSRHN